MSEELKTQIRTLIDEVYHKGNLDAMDNLYAADIVLYQPPLPDLEGLAAVKEYTAGVFSAWSDIQVTIHEIVVEGGTAVARLTFAATHSGETPGLRIPPTGKRASLESCSIVHLRDGKVVEQWLYNDFLGYLQQLGAIPAPPAA